MPKRYVHRWIVWLRLFTDRRHIAGIVLTVTLNNKQITTIFMCIYSVLQGVLKSASGAALMIGPALGSGFYEVR